jgi:hypothetical protein
MLTRPKISDNNGMNDTHSELDVETADQMAVHEHVATGKPLDPEIAARVRARGEKITERLRTTYGERPGISAGLIREVRDGA